MSAPTSGATFLQRTGVIFAVCLAGTLLWTQLHRDVRAGEQRWQAVAALKRSYRRQAALLTCWEKPGLFSADRPSPVQKRFIPTLDQRETGFDYPAIDRMIEEQECRMDTTPQNVDLARYEHMPLIGQPQNLAPKLYAGQGHAFAGVAKP